MEAGRESFPRKKRRLLVQFLDRNGTKVTAFTLNVSFTGLFVLTNVLPEVREQLTLMLHLPNGKIVSLPGVVVRHGPPPGGFGFALSGYSEEFTQLVAGLP